jgi:hypothetical protein
LCRYTTVGEELMAPGGGGMEAARVRVAELYLKVGLYTCQLNTRVNYIHVSTTYTCQMQLHP